VPYSNTCSSSAVESQHSDVNIIQQNALSENLLNSSGKRKRDCYMREYRKKKKANKNRKWTSNGSNPGLEFELDSCSDILVNY